MNINEVTQLIEAADKCGHVPLISGLHGVGKSESAAQYAKNNKLHYEPLILSLMDTGDMLGLPDKENVSGMTSTIWAAPSWYSNIVNAAWPLVLRFDQLQFIDTDLQDYVLNYATVEDGYVKRDELNRIYCEYYDLPDDHLQILRQENVNYLKGKRSLLFLDEFNRAPQDILNASLQLILDHRLHTHILPRVRGQETLIVAAINPADGDYTVQEFDPALLDRFVTCEVEADFKAWLQWAKKTNVNQIVIDFLIDNQRKFHFTPEDGTKGTSPRSWTRLANYIDRINDTNKDIMSYYVKGTVGSSVAAQFLMFYNNYGSGITTEEIMKIVKKEVRKLQRNKKALNPEEIAQIIEPIVDKLEAIRKMEFAETLIKEYIDKDPQEAFNMLVYLYALPVENLVAVLKRLQSDNPEHYTTLAGLDREFNKKKLFLKLVANLKGFK